MSKKHAQMRALSTFRSTTYKECEPAHIIAGKENIWRVWHFVPKVLLIFVSAGL